MSMRKRCMLVAVACLPFWSYAWLAQAATERTAAQIVAGRFVAAQEQPEAVWFVYPGLATRQLITDWASLQKAISVAGQSVSSDVLGQLADGSTPTFDQEFAKRVRGKIFLDPTTGEGWYVSPRDFKRYPVRSGPQARPIFWQAKLGISQTNLAKLPTADSADSGDEKLRQRLSGNVLFSKADGTFWYVSLKDRKRYPLNTDADAQQLLTTQLFGITAGRLERIPRFTDAVTPVAKTFRLYAGSFVRSDLEPDHVWYVSPRQKKRLALTPDNWVVLIAGEKSLITAKGLATITIAGEAEYSDATVTTSRGDFRVKILRSDLSLPGLRLLTIGGDAATCTDSCTTFSVGSFAQANDAIVAVNGTYFCPLEQPNCADKADSYYNPFFHSVSQVMLNQELVATSPYPLLAFDTQNKPYYFHTAAEFGSPEAFHTATGATVQAAIANWPALVENGLNVIDSQVLDSGQKNTRAVRVFFGVQGRTVVFGIVYDATVIDAAAAAQALGLDYAINLDGGSSTALWRYGKYVHGPGRTVPNVIVIQRVPVSS